MTSATSNRPDDGEYAAFYRTYIAKIPEGDIITTLENQAEHTVSLLADVGEAEAEKHHPPYTWSIKDVLAHLIDAERIFAARALCFARGDANKLPGFDENQYAVEARADARPVGDLIQEFHDVRRSSIALFRGLPGDAWRRRGVANGHPVSVRALAYIIAGHERHHIDIVGRRLSQP